MNNIAVATPHYGCNASLMQLDMHFFCCDSSHNPTVATPSVVFVLRLQLTVATPNMFSVATTSNMFSVVVIPNTFFVVVTPSTPLL
jgi:hypothetical protein